MPVERCMLLFDNRALLLLHSSNKTSDVDSTAFYSKFHWHARIGADDLPLSQEQAFVITRR